MAVTLEEGTALVSLAAGILGYSIPESVPPSTLDIVDGLAQTSATVAEALSALAPKNAKLGIAAAALSTVGVFTGSAKFLEDYDNVTQSDFSSQLAVVGDAVAVLGDVAGALAPYVNAAKPTYAEILKALSAVLTGASVTITTLQFGSAQLAETSAELAKALNGLDAALAALSAAGVLQVGPITNVLTDATGLVSSFSAGNYGNFVKAAAAFAADVNSAYTTLFNLLGLSSSNSTDVTEVAGPNGTATITSGDGSFTATATIASSSSVESSLFTISTDYPYSVSGTDSFNSGTDLETLSSTAQAGSETASQSTQTDSSGLASEQQASFGGLTIDTSVSDPVYLTTNASGSLVAEVLSSVPADDVAIETASDGSDQIFLGSAGGSSATPLVTYAPGSLSGDTLSIGYSSSGTVDVTTDIANGDTATISSDDALSGTSQDFDFAGSTGTLKLDSPATFTGTISTFQPGDTIDLSNIGTVTGATFSTTDVLAIQESGGGTITLNLDPTDNYDSESFLLTPDGNGGTEIIAESDSEAIAFTGTDEDLLVINAGSLVGTISAFLSGDTIDLAGISATGAAFSSGNVLTVQENGGGSVTLNLDPTEDYSEDSLLIAPDGAGGTDITVESDFSISFTSVNEKLLVVDVSDLIDTIIPAFEAGDTIDLLNATGATYGQNEISLLYRNTNVTLTLFPSDEPGDDSFLLAPDGNGGTQISAESDDEPITFTGPNEELIVSDAANLTGVISNLVPGAGQDESAKWELSLPIRSTPLKSSIKLPKEPTP